ncbi:MAG TPA: hypothetical protein VKV26_19005 [Dehalococcoidia bacterium]|nr:hypothetical protein [Dehalococcoidia bacterium]
MFRHRAKPRHVEVEDEAIVAETADDALLIADWQGRLYRIPRAMLARYEVESAEGLGGHAASAAALPLLGTALEQRRGQRNHPHDDGRDR